MCVALCLFVCVFFCALQAEKNVYVEEREEAEERCKSETASKQPAVATASVSLPPSLPLPPRLPPLLLFLRLNKHTQRLCCQGSEELVLQTSEPVHLGSAFCAQIYNWIDYRHVINYGVHPQLWIKQLIGLCHSEAERGSRLVQEGLLDYYRWALRPICIVSDFKSLIALLVQKLPGCVQHTGWDWTSVTNLVCFSEEDRNTYRAHTAGYLSVLITIRQKDACGFLFH